MDIKKLLMQVEVIAKGGSGSGEHEGHEFHGNQYTGEHSSTKILGEHLSHYDFSKEEARWLKDGTIEHHVKALEDKIGRNLTSKELSMFSTGKTPVALEGYKNAARIEGLIKEMHKEKGSRVAVIDE